MNKLALIACIATAQAAAQAPPDYGHNFITISDAGNAAYDREDNLGFTTGRGSVDYEYRIAQTEVTSAQFVDFLNGWRSSGGALNALGASNWGGFFDGSQWSVFPGQELHPVGGFSWREAAMYTNWLHNGKPTNNLDGFQSGAYDTSTFTFTTDPRPAFGDQTTRSPGAKYWIPSYDEWIKAAHYDPNKDGQGDGGWWLYSDSSDTQPVPGMPGVGETSAGVDISPSDAFDIPLMSYPETQTPWGLLDTSGGGTEWTEEWHAVNGPDERERRVWQGNAAGTQTWNPLDKFSGADIAWRSGSDRPNLNSIRLSLRVASAIPAPGVGVGLVCGFGFFAQRRRRYE